MPSTASRPRVANAGGRAALMRGLSAVALPGAFLAFSFAPFSTTTADAATFQLADGLRIEGRISAVGRRYLTIDTDAGSRLVSRSALVEVSVALDDGGTVAGALQDWRDGEYTLNTAKGVVTAREARARKPQSAAGTALAAAPAPTPKPSPKPEVPPAPPTQESKPADRPAPAEAEASDLASEAKQRVQTARLSGQARTIDSFSDIGGSDRVRGMLDGILSGDAAESEEGAQVAATAPPVSAAPPAPSPAPEPPVAAAPPPPSAAPAPPPENAPPAAAETPSATLLQQRRSDAGLRDPAEDYRDGVLGGDRAAPDRARSCARLSRLVGPPVTSEPAGGGGKRPDRRALLMAIGGDYATEAIAALAASFYQRAAAEASIIEKVEQPEFAAQVEAKSLRISLPEVVAAQRFDAPEDAAHGVKAGVADLALSASRGAGGEARGRLVAFDAVTVVPHPKNPLDTLTRRDLAALLSGAASDWSMIRTELVGAPTLYLPPQRSAELVILSELAGVRRIKPRSVRYIPDPRERLWAALTDPLGLAVVPRSTLGDAAPLAIGRTDVGVLPTRDNIRNATYPMIAPVYVSAPESPLNPSATGFADFLAAPEGQRALFDAGLIPVAACDPSTCTLHADGLDEARERLRSAHQTTALSQIGAEQIPLSAASAPLARFDFPPSLQRTPLSIVDRLADAIAALAQEDNPDRPLIVAARAGLPGSEAGAERSRLGAVRAEATALALRCAGLNVQRFGVDPSARSGGSGSSGEETAGEIRVEVLGE